MSQPKDDLTLAQRVTEAEAMLAIDADAKGSWWGRLLPDLVADWKRLLALSEGHAMGGDLDARVAEFRRLLSGFCEDCCIIANMTQKEIVGLLDALIADRALLDARLGECLRALHLWDEWGGTPTWGGPALEAACDATAAAQSGAGSALLAEAARLRDFHHAVLDANKSCDDLGEFSKRVQAALAAERNE